MLRAAHDFHGHLELYFLDSVGHKVHSVGTLMTKTQHVADIASIE